jgi:hypothetical protein
MATDPGKAPRVTSTTSTRAITAGRKFFCTYEEWWVGCNEDGDDDDDGKQD